MTISALDPGAALVLVDLQQGTLANPRLIEADSVVANAARLATAFRPAGLTVVRVTYDPVLTPSGRTQVGGGARPSPPGFTDAPPSLPADPDDVAVAKGGWSAFSAPGLDTRLRELGVTQVFVCGVATTFGVESTARDAYDAGFDVVVVADAVTDMSPESTQGAMSWVFPVLGETGSTDEVLALLDQA